MKFVIVSPRSTHGGAIVLHALCKYLTDLGFDAKVFYNAVNVYENDNFCGVWMRWIKAVINDTVTVIASKCNVGQRNNIIPMLKCKRKYLPWVGNDTIVVYPEISCGNFLRAKNVVRWFLYHNRYKDKTDAYGENDLFISYREVFNDFDLNPNNLTVCTPYFDLDTYKQYNFEKRHGTCYVVRKGKDRPDLPKEFDGVVIDKLSEPEKVKVFNECEYCISYDTQTAYSGIAALCGCISIVVPEPGKTKADYRKPEDSTDGIAWGFSDEEIRHAIQTRHNVYLKYLELNESSKKSAESFVQICKDYFKIV